MKLLDQLREVVRVRHLATVQADHAGTGHALLKRVPSLTRRVGVNQEIRGPGLFFERRLAR
jgi:hypothetical protein